MVLVQEEHPAQVVTQECDKLKALGDCHAAASQYEQAIGFYREACRLAPPANYQPRLALAAVAMQQEQLDLAREAYRAVLDMDDCCGDAYTGLAAIAQQDQDYGQAFDLYLKSLECDSDNLLALLGLFQASCQMGTFAKIISYLDVYLQKHPGDTAVMFCLSTLCARDGDLARARGLVLRVLSLEPGKPEAMQLLLQVESRLASQPR